MLRFGTTQSLPPDVLPLIVDAYYASIGSTLYLLFDTPMDVPLPDIGDVFFRWNNFELHYNNWGWQNPQTLTADYLHAHVNNGPNITSWVGGPMKLFSTDGFPCSPWTDYPLRKVPP